MNRSSFLIAHRRRLRAVLALACCAAAFALPAPWAGAAPAAATVEITKFAFAPKEITVEPGARVTWINHDETPHTIASGDKSFLSQGLDTDDKFEHTFAKEGDFNYICTLHPFMTGIVHVRRR